MIRILFWNLARRELNEMVARICRERAVDIVILAEFAGRSADLMRAVNAANDGVLYRWADTLCRRIDLLHTGQIDTVTVKASSGYYVISCLQPKTGPEIIIAAVHFPSKRHAGTGDQLGFAEDVRREIDRLEREAGHERSLVVGDFNMNPFDPGMISARGFHAVMDRRIAMRRKRRIDNIDYGYFYNPMWSLLGDRHGLGTQGKRIFLQCETSAG